MKSSGFRLVAGSSDWRCRMVQEGQMIVLDEDAVAQRLAMIRSSAEEDRPLLKCAKARDRFSRVQDRHGVPRTALQN
jgi:hypothetical protein